MTGVRVRENESIESAIRRFKKLCEKAGILAELRKREHYEKPSVKRKKKAIAAMKTGDRLTLSTLRLLLSALHNEEIKGRRDLTTEEIHRTIATLRKQRIEAIELFRKGGRAELAEKEEAELKVLQRF